MISEEIIWPKQDCDGVFVLKYDEIVCGSDYYFDDDGNIIETEPEYITFYTLLDGSLRCESKGEIQEEIDNLIQQAIDRKIDLDIMIETLNKDN